MRILGSVKNLREAQLLLQTPIDIVDLKNPGHGALGAVSLDTVRAVVASTDGARAISAAAGCAEDHDILERVWQLSHQGVDFVKVGFSELPQCSQLPRLRAAMASSTQAVAVLFADCEEIRINEWIAPAKAAGFSGLMLDTANKHSGPLLQHITPDEAQQWIHRVRAFGLFCGLAGRLNAQTALAYLPAQPDYMGFRSALCTLSMRTASINLSAIQSLLHTLGRINEAKEAPAFSGLSAPAGAHSAN